jgi:hypothetical protein
MYKALKKFTIVFLAVLSLIVVVNGAVTAQDVPVVDSTSPQTCSVPSSLKTQQVIADNGGDQVKMGDRIRVRVEGLSEAARNEATDSKFNPRQLVLYLNGYELEDIHGEPVLAMVRHENMTVVDSDWLAFRLDRTNKSESIWNALLGGTPRRSINVIVGVGCPDQLAIEVADPQSPPQLNIVLLSWRFVLSSLLFLVILLIFLKYGRHALRSSGVEGTYYEEEKINGETQLTQKKLKLNPKTIKIQLLVFCLVKERKTRTLLVYQYLNLLGGHF